MMKFLFSLTAVALLGAAPAFAQDAVRVPFGDLDLSSVAGAEALDARIADAARETCRMASPRLVDRVCVRRVTRDALRTLPRERQEDYARARRAGPIMAMTAPGWPA